MDKPLYQQIETYIEERIETGIWPIGFQIPKERELCIQFHASRMTVSKALGSLVIKGLIYRNAGKGSFVRMRFPENKIQNLFSFSENMKRIGKETSSVIKSYGISLAKEHPNVMDVLRLQEIDYLHRISRLRVVEGIAVGVQIIFLSASIIPAIDVRILENSLFEYFENTLHLKISRNEERVQAIFTNEIINDLFEKKIEQPLLKVTSIAYLDDQRPFQVSETYYLADCYEYTATTFR